MIWIELQRRGGVGEPSRDLNQKIEAGVLGMLARAFDKKISILVLGKDIDTNIAAQYNRADGDVRLMSYRSLIAEARERIGWLIKEIT